MGVLERLTFLSFLEGGTIHNDVDSDVFWDIKLVLRKKKSICSNLYALFSFRSYVKSQKSMREEIARASEKPIEKISEEISEMMKLLSAINSGISRNMNITNKLKFEVAKVCIQNLFLSI